MVIFEFATLVAEMRLGSLSLELSLVARDGAGTS